MDIQIDIAVSLITLVCAENLGQEQKKGNGGQWREAFPSFTSGVKVNYIFISFLLVAQAPQMHPHTRRQLM